MASKVDIANLALQKLGSRRITALTDDSDEARAVLNTFEHSTKLCLQSHPWVFATKRAELAEDTDAPLFERDHRYQLPSDYLRLLPPDEGCKSPYDDKQVEGRYIVSDFDSPLQIRYTAHIEDVNFYPPLFREVLACSIAIQICEELTNSSTKKKQLIDERKEWLREARRQNAFEGRPRYPDVDVWEMVRY